MSDPRQAMNELLPRADHVPEGTTMMANSEAIDWLATRVREREPTAVVRFGDGEARLLEAGITANITIDDAIRVLARQAEISLSSQTVHDLQPLIALAYDEADVLGIRYGARHAGRRKRDWLERLAVRYAKRVERGMPPAILANCLLSYPLAQALPELLAGRRVSVISCRDLKPILENDWGTVDVATYQIPSQVGVRDVDGPYEEAMHSERIWPDAHHRVRSELSVRERGEVFLVGAGVFGKDLCIEVRRRGGIAIDMGSALDHIAGKVTRGPKRKALELHREGLDLTEITTEMCRIYQTDVDEDTVAKHLEAILAGTE